MTAETITYRGFKIEISHDQNSLNPFVDWDCCTPLMCNSDSHVNDFSNGEINKYLADVLTDGQIIRHQNALSEVLEMDIEDLDKESKIDEIRYEIRQNMNFDALALVCDIAKVPYLNTNSRGYSQGDYADVFTCYTDTFESISGCTMKQLQDGKQLEGNVNLFGYWAWGDVYSFYIEYLDDSCGGFFGDNHEESGLLEMAKGEIDAHINSIRKQKISKLKALIKANVPLIFRETILTQVTV